MAKASTTIHFPLLGSVHLAPMIRSLMQMILNEISAFESVFEQSEPLNAPFVYPDFSCSMVFPRCFQSHPRIAHDFFLSQAELPFLALSSLHIARSKKSLWLP